EPGVHALLAVGGVLGLRRQFEEHAVHHAVLVGDDVGHLAAPEAAVDVEYQLVAALHGGDAAGEDEDVDAVFGGPLADVAPGEDRAICEVAVHEHLWARVYTRAPRVVAPGSGPRCAVSFQRRRKGGLPSRNSTRSSAHSSCA